MMLASPNFDVKSIIFSQFWSRAFSQNCWKKPLNSFPMHTLIWSPVHVDRKGDQKEGKEKKKREKKVVAKEMAQDDEGGEEWQEVTGKGGAPIVTVSPSAKKCVFQVTHMFSLR